MIAWHIETRDARNDPRWNQELINEGVKYQVPCLRLVKEDGSKEWMYGSSNIIQYLDGNTTYYQGVSRLSILPLPVLLPAGVWFVPES